MYKANQTEEKATRRSPIDPHKPTEHCTPRKAPHDAALGSHEGIVTCPSTPCDPPKQTQTHTAHPAGSANISGAVSGPVSESVSHIITTSAPVPGPAGTSVDDLPGGLPSMTSPGPSILSVEEDASITGLASRSRASTARTSAGVPTPNRSPLLALLDSKSSKPPAGDMNEGKGLFREESMEGTESREASTDVATEAFRTHNLSRSSFALEHHTDSIVDTRRRGSESLFSYSNKADTDTLTSKSISRNIGGYNTDTWRSQSNCNIEPNIEESFLSSSRASFDSDSKPEIMGGGGGRGVQQYVSQADATSTSTQELKNSKAVIEEGSDEELFRVAGPAMQLKEVVNWARTTTIALRKNLSKASARIDELENERDKSKRRFKNLQERNISLKNNLDTMVKFSSQLQMQLSRESEQRNKAMSDAQAEAQRRKNLESKLHLQENSLKETARLLKIATCETEAVRRMFPQAARGLSHGLAHREAAGARSIVSKARSTPRVVGNLSGRIPAGSPGFRTGLATLPAGTSGPEGVPPGYSSSDRPTGAAMSALKSASNRPAGSSPLILRRRRKPRNRSKGSMSWTPRDEPLLEDPSNKNHLNKHQLLASLSEDSKTKPNNSTPVSMSIAQTYKRNSKSTEVATNPHQAGPKPRTQPEAVGSSAVCVPPGSPGVRASNPSTPTRASPLHEPIMHTPLKGTDPSMQSPTRGLTSEFQSFGVGKTKTVVSSDVSSGRSSPRGPSSQPSNQLQAQTPLKPHDSSWVPQQSLYEHVSSSFASMATQATSLLQGETVAEIMAQAEKSKHDAVAGGDAGVGGSSWTESMNDGELKSAILSPVQVYSRNTSDALSFSFSPPSPCVGNTASDAVDSYDGAEAFPAEAKAEDARGEDKGADPRLDPGHDPHQDPHHDLDHDLDHHPHHANDPRHPPQHRPQHHANDMPETRGTTMHNAVKNVLDTPDGKRSLLAVGALKKESLDDFCKRLDTLRSAGKCVDPWKAPRALRNYLLRTIFHGMKCTFVWFWTGGKGTRFVASRVCTWGLSLGVVAVWVPVRIGRGVVRAIDGRLETMAVNLNIVPEPDSDTDPDPNPNPNPDLNLKPRLEKGPESNDIEKEYIKRSLKAKRHANRRLTHRRRLSITLASATHVSSTRFTSTSKDSGFWESAHGIEGETRNMRA